MSVHPSHSGGSANELPVSLYLRELPTYREAFAIWESIDSVYDLLEGLTIPYPKVMAELRDMSGNKMLLLTELGDAMNRVYRSRIKRI